MNRVPRLNGIVKKPRPALPLWYGLLLVPFFGPPQGELPALRTELIPTGTWSYRSTLGGAPEGEMRSVIRRDSSRIRSTSDKSGSFIQRTSVTVEDRTLLPLRSSTFLYRPGAGSTTARLEYSTTGDSLAVRGTISWGSIANPPAPVSIARTFPVSGHFDNQSLDLLIISLPLERGGAWRVGIFDPTTFDEIIPVTIDVRGRTRVETPAGGFEAWRVEVRGFSDRVEYFFETSTRVLVAQHIYGSELRFELTSELRPPF